MPHPGWHLQQQTVTDILNYCLHLHGHGSAARPSSCPCTTAKQSLHANAVVASACQITGIRPSRRRHVPKPMWRLSPSPRLLSLPNPRRRPVGKARNSGKGGDQRGRRAERTEVRAASGGRAALARRAWSRSSRAAAAKGNPSARG